MDRMDRTALLASCPQLVADLRDEATATATETERQRVLQLLDLGEACDAKAIARYAAEDGSSVAEMLPRFRNFAAKNEVTARQFFATCERLRIDAGESPSAREARKRASDGSRSLSNSAEGRSLLQLFAADLGDRMADALGLPPDPGPR